MGAMNFPDNRSHKSKHDLFVKKCFLEVDMIYGAIKFPVSFFQQPAKTTQDLDF